MMTCKACRLPDQASLSLAFASGDSLRAIAARVGLSRDAIRRHRLNCAAQTPTGREIIRAVAARAIEDAETIVEEIHRLKGDAQRLAEKAEATGDLRCALAAVKTLSEIAIRLEELVARNPNEAEPIRVSFTFAGSGAAPRAPRSPDPSTPDDADAPQEKP
jgi:hypothetical protein